MGVNLNLTKEQIMEKYNSLIETLNFPTLDEMDTLAYYNEEYLKNNGWEQRQGIGFYFNDKYTTNRYTYWVDCNAINFSAYRTDKLTKEKVKVGEHDRRTDNDLHFYDIVDFIAWLDGAIGHEEEYCLSCTGKKEDESTEAIPDRYDDCVIWFLCGEDQQYGRPIPQELIDIQNEWRELARETGDEGSCVIGEGMLFRYCNKWYFMKPSSPWQGEGSWTPHVSKIKKMLTAIGADNIVWECGRLD